MPAAAVRQPIVAFGLLGAGLVGVVFSGPAVVPVASADDFLTRQTARVAVLFWAVAEAALLLGRAQPARAAWVVGAATFLVHVATAFDRVHGWSHAAAFRHVQEVSGFGPGIFVSYMFSLVWVADAGWWCAAPRSYDRRATGLDWAIHGFLAFVVFNGTVVYEAGFIRWAGVVLFAGLAALLVRRTLADVPLRR